MKHWMKLLLLIPFILTACGSAEPKPIPTVSFMVFGDPAEKQAYEALVNAFHAKQSAVKVQLTHIPGQSEYRQRLAADFAAGTPADIVLINYRRFAGFAAKGSLEPLGLYLDKSTLIKHDDFYAESMGSFEWNGQLTCIPQNLSSLVVYYNKNLFDQAGLAYPKDDWTWEEFQATAKALTIDADNDGNPEQYGLGTEASIFRVTPFIWQNGGDLVDDPAKPTRLNLNTPEAAGALEWFTDLQVQHHVIPSREQELAEPHEVRFLNGRLGMILNSRRGVPTYREITSFDWDVAPLPTGKSRAGILHADGYCLAAASKEKTAAWAFIEFANSVEGQTLVAASGRTVPSLRSVAESPAFLDPNAKPANSRVFLDVIPYIRSVPVMDTWVDIEEIMNIEFERALHGDIGYDEAMRLATERSAEFFPQP